MLEFSEKLRLAPNVKIASTPRRILAAMLDLALFGLVFWGSALLAVAILKLVQPDKQAVAILQPLILFTSVCVYLGVYLVLLDRKGQTPGKFICKLRIVTPMGGRPGSDRMFFFRFLVPRLLIPITLGMSFLLDMLYLFSQNGRTIHDRMAGTIVIELGTPERAHVA